VTPANFRAASASVNWHAAIRDHLASLPPCQAHTPAQDLALVERAFMGLHIGGFVDQKRVQDLLRGARNDQYNVTLDGQRALLDALKARAATG
jgi:hypothetical protein